MYLRPESTRLQSRQVAPTRYESVGCDEGRFISLEECEPNASNSNATICEICVRQKVERVEKDNSQQSTVNSQRTTVNGQQTTDNSQRTTVNGQQTTVNSQQSTATEYRKVKRVENGER